MVTLSSIFSPTIVSGIQWPLGPGSSPPLYFQSLEDLQISRKSKSTPIEDLVQDIPAAIQDLFSGTDAVESHFGRIATALLLLGYGYTDECHNLVTPMSWPDDIHFAHGPSIYDQVDPAVKAFATYTHCLVHRREAFNVGEFGMMGFGNANYWSSAVQSCQNDSLPHSELQSMVVDLAAKYKDSQEVQAWCHQHGFVETTAKSVFFESRAIHELCATVQRNPEENPRLLAFAEEIVSSEVQVLLRSALEKAGYSSSGITDSCAKKSVSSMVDETTALAAMKTISSAHLSNFMADGCIILRRVVRSIEDEDVLAASAGVACGLLQSPGCKLQVECQPNQKPICAMIPITESGAIALRAKLSADLAVGDCFAAAMNECPPNVDGVVIRCFQPCPKEDPDAVFLDPFYGTRGETPTTVVQWSKGTIF